MIAILGPTSSGKTSMAVKLAKKHGFEIISCDSRQIYKYFDIGTGKIPVGDDYTYRKEQECVILNGTRIYGYDLIEPEQRFSAGDFSNYVKNISLKIVSNGKTPLLVGGTGFYAEAAFGAYDDFPSISVSESVISKLESSTLEEIKNLFPSDILDGLNNSEIHNKQRLIRKYIIYKKLGYIPKRKFSIDESNLIVLTSDNSFLFARTDIWAKNIFEDLINETKILLKNGFGNSIPMQGIIYKSVRSLLLGDFEKEECFERIKYDLHAYVRRQKTWFKKYKTADIVDISSPDAYNKVESLVSKKLNAK